VGERVRHALITAGTKGIGRAVTDAFLREGFAVTVNYRSDAGAAERLKTDWKEAADRLLVVQGDVTRAEDIERLFRLSMERFGRVDFLINNAGPFIFERKKLVDLSEAEWLDVLHGNLTAVFRLGKRVIPVMRRQRFGRIVTFGFQNADDAPGWIDRGAFAAAKVGLVSLTRTIALEEAEHGITANMILPGLILPDMKEATAEQARRLARKRTPFGRSVTGEDIARAILFLCSDAAEMITGSVLDLTGAVDVVNRFRPRFEDDSATS